MRYRQAGGTGLCMSEVCLGTTFAACTRPSGDARRGAFISVFDPHGCA